MYLNDIKFNSSSHLEQLPQPGANPHPKLHGCTSRAVRSTEGTLLRLFSQNASRGLAVYSQSHVG